MKKSWMSRMKDGLGWVFSQTKNGRAGCLSALFLLTTAGPVLALQSGDYTYELNPGNTTVTITGYTGSGGVVSIPSTLAGKTVTSIGQSAFQSCTSLTSVTIPIHSDISNCAL